jgi:hypothetical protein
MITHESFDLDKIRRERISRPPKIHKNEIK